jgi:hypothetical protein
VNDRPMAMVLPIMALALAACGTEPIELADRYTLSAVDGGPPPRLVGATIECDVLVAGGRLTFGPADQFELGLDVLTECPPGEENPDAQTFGYTGTADVAGGQVTFHTAIGGSPLVFEGQVARSGRFETVVPGIVPIRDEVAVEFVPE